VFELIQVISAADQVKNFTNFSCGAIRSRIIICRVTVSEIQNVSGGF
jgi:hypothetical protein